MGKFIHKYGANTWLNYFEKNNTGLTEMLLRRDIDVILELDSLSKKKVAMFGVCSVFLENLAKFSPDFLNFLTSIMIDLLDKFNKTNLNLVFNDNVLTLSDNCYYQANSVNKLLNTEIKVRVVFILC